MKLEEFKVEGFRCLANTEWIPLKKITIFTGQNDGGKTSVLDALAIFLDPKAKPDAADYRITDETGGRVEKVTMGGKFKLTLQEQQALRVTDASVHVKTEYSSDNSTVTYETRVHPDERLRRDISQIPLQELRDLADEFHISLTNRASKQPVVEEITTWISEQTLVPGWLTFPSSMYANLPQAKVFESAGALDPEHEINSTLRNSFTTRIRGESYSGRLNEISTQIESEMREDLNLLIPIVKKYCPDIVEVSINPSFDYSSGFKTSRLLLKKSGAPPIDLEKEGEGRKRRITLAVYEWRESIFSAEEAQTESDQLILAFDEPDTHLDYLSQRKIFEIIKKIGQLEHTNVIVCTHSLNLIDRIPLTDVVHFELKNRETHIRTIASEDQKLIDLFMYQISDAMGLRNSVMLNERCFLVVEGLTEMTALPVLFNLRYGFSPQAAGVRIVNGEGGAGARLFAKFLNDGNRNVVFMVDRDTQTFPRARYFTPQSFTADGINIQTQVHFVGVNEFEDTFSDTILLRAAQQFWTTYDGSPWTINEFTALRSSQDFAEDLVALVRSRTHKMIGKPDIGYDIARSLTDRTEIPLEILSCIEHAYNAANVVE
jgi:predicted ATP-dependent endonuclease of OLD family